MSTGGWKWSDFVYQFGTKGSESNNTFAMKQSNSIIQAATQAIVNANEGWGYDSEFTADKDSFTKIGTNSDYNYYVACQFLKHSNGARLCVRYTVCYQVCAKTVDSRNGVYGSNWEMSGLAMSIIPPGSPNNWDLSSNGTTENFIPYDATRFVGTAWNFSANLSESNVRNDVIYSYSTTARYVFGVKGDSVFFGVNKRSNVSSESSGLSLNFVGKMFGNLSNPDDSGYCSLYGALSTVLGSSESSSNSLLVTKDSFSGAHLTYFRKSVDALPPSGDNGSSFSMKCFNTNSAALDQKTTNAKKSGKVIFGAVGAYILSTDAQTYGVVQGNGMKGYLDTDTFRVVFPEMTRGTLLDDGRFIYAGGGWAIGWDKTNTITLWD